MHGLVILDEKDQVIRPAILWNDGRTTEECDYLNNVIGKDKLSEYTLDLCRLSSHRVFIGKDHIIRAVLRIITTQRRVVKNTGVAVISC